MQTYKVEYYTLSRGRDSDSKAGNMKQFDDVAYIQCIDTSRIEVLMAEFYRQAVNGVYYVPVVKQISAVKGDVILDCLRERT